MLSITVPEDRKGKAFFSAWIWLLCDGKREELLSDSKDPEFRKLALAEFDRMKKEVDAEVRRERAKERGKKLKAKKRH